MRGHIPAGNVMFQAVMKNPELSAELVERLLGVRVRQVEYPELEKAIAPYYTSKGVRLDVYLKDEDKAIDVELQSYPQKAVEAALVAIKDFGAFPEAAAEKMGAPLDLVLEALEAQTTVSPAN